MLLTAESAKSPKISKKSESQENRKKQKGRKSESQQVRKKQIVRKSLSRKVRKSVCYLHLSYHNVSFSLILFPVSLHPGFEEEKNWVPSASNVAASCPTSHLSYFWMNLANFNNLYIMSKFAPKLHILLRYMISISQLCTKTQKNLTSERCILYLYLYLSG